MNLFVMLEVRKKSYKRTPGLLTMQAQVHMQSKDLTLTPFSSFLFCVLSSHEQCSQAMPEER